MMHRSTRSTMLALATLAGLTACADTGSLTAPAAPAAAAAASEQANAELRSDAATAPRTARAYFVAPTGHANGNGTKERPWALAALAKATAVQPGDTIYLLGGTYRGDFTSRLAGTAARPIIVRQAPGARATIDGRLDILGKYTWYWGFEVTYSDTRRATAQRGSDPTDIPREAKTIFVSGPYNKLIHLVVHDLGDGIGAFAAAEGTEITGSLVYNNGWEAPDRGHGHGLYLQNRGATQTIADNAIFNNFSTGIKISGSTSAPLQNFTVEGNSSFSNGVPATRFGPQYNMHLDGGTKGQARGIRIVRNSFFQAIGTAYTATLSPTEGADATFADNVSQGRAEFGSWARLSVSGNQFTTGTTVLSGGANLLTLRVNADTLVGRGAWAGNRYVTPASPRVPFVVARPSGTALVDLAGWRRLTGESATSALNLAAPALAFGNTQVVVRPSRYEAGRALVTVWNWAGAGAVSLNLTGVLQRGDRYQIHHVYDVYGAPVAQGQFTGAAVSLPVRDVPAPQPLGHTARIPSTGAAFNVYVVRRL